MASFVIRYVPNWISPRVVSTGAMTYGRSSKKQIAGLNCAGPVLMSASHAQRKERPINFVRSTITGWFYCCFSQKSFTALLWLLRRSSRSQQSKEAISHWHHSSLRPTAQCICQKWRCNGDFPIKLQVTLQVLHVSIILIWSSFAFSKMYKRSEQIFSYEQS